MEYNLLERPWIPCLEFARRVIYRSLLETLERAPDILEIADPSPLVTVAVHRLLLAVLHRTFRGPATEADWRALWQRGDFDTAPLESYLLPLQHRFDLFDLEQPFYQTAGIDERHARSAARLAHELASGNNTTLFNHTVESMEPVYSSGHAARMLVALQAFALGGTVSREEAAHKSADSAPLAKTAVALVKGENLFQTLVLNMVLYDCASEQPYACSGLDLPAWEQDDPVRPADRLPRGYLDWLTWQSRQVQLFPAVGPAGEPVVPRAAVLKGYQLPAAVYRRSYETMVAFYKVRKPSPGQEPWTALGFREDRTLWRDSLALFRRFDDRTSRGSIDQEPQQPPITLQELSSKLPATAIQFPLDLYGLEASQASVLLWRQERITVPLVYLRNEDLYFTLADGMRMAQDTRKALQSATAEFAKLLLAPDSSNKRRRQPDAGDRSNLTAHLGAERLYWASLELPFRDLVNDLIKEQQRADVDLEHEGALPAWYACVRAAAQDALRRVTGSLEQSTRVLKARALAELDLAKALRR